MDHDGIEYLRTCFRDIGEEAFDAAFVIDDQAHFVEISPEFSSLLGCRDSELKGRPFASVLNQTPKVRGLISDFGVRLFDRSIDRHVEIELRGRSGEPIPVTYRSRFVTDENNRTTGVMVVVRDLRSLHRELEEKSTLLQTRATVYEMLGTLGDMVMLCDHKGRIVFANTAFYDLLGYCESDIVGMHAMELSPFEGTYQTINGRTVTLSREYVEGQVEKVGELFAKGAVTYEIYIKRKDGIIIPMETTCTLQRDLHGNPRGSIIICRDISRRSGMLEELRETRDYLERVIEGSRDAIVLSDSTGTIVRANSYFLEILGCDREEVIGRHSMEFAPPEEGRYESVAGELIDIDCAYYEDIKQKIGQLLEHGSLRDWNAYFLRKDGKLVPVEHSVFFIHNDNGERIGSVSICRETTNRRRAEIEKEKMALQLQHARMMETMSVLAGGVAHDFNNALMGIIGNIELMKQQPGGGGSGALRHLTAMESSAFRMADLTSQLLAYSRGGKYYPGRIAPDRVIRDAVVRAIKNAPDGICLETDISEEPVTIEADCNQMQMVLSAVLNNAFEAVDQTGRVAIAMRVVDIDQYGMPENTELLPGRYVQMDIADTGHGMDGNTLAKLFEPFYSTKRQGRGLGMAAVYGIVKNHGGDIRAVSAPGRGTTITIYLPVSVSPAEILPQQQDDAPKANSGKVLIVEDEEEVISVTTEMLEASGYSVLQAHSGKEAIAAVTAQAAAIEVVLLDIGLPDQSGDKVYRQLMDRWPELKVIVCTGFSIEGPAQRIIDAGAQGFIQKPYKFADLKQKLQEVLGKE